MKLKSPSLLRAHMDSAGMSTRQLAEHAGLKHHSFIDHLRAGRKTSCSIETGTAIAEALGVDTSVLFDVRKSPTTGHTVNQQNPAA